MVKSLLKPEIKTLLDKSAASEMYAHFLYQYIANQLQRLGLFGAQKYFLKESVDELSHYNILVGYANDLGDVLGTPAVPKITDKVPSLMDALELAYETELDLLNQYKSFYEEAEDKYEDCVTATFLIELLQIQRKSVGEYADFIAKFNLKGDIYEFDEFLGEK